VSWLRAVRDTSVAASSRSFSGQATPPSCTTACTKATGMPCVPKPTSSMRTSARGPGPAARPGQDRGRGAHGGGLAGRRICEEAGEVLPEQCRRRARAGRRDAGPRCPLVGILVDGRGVTERRRTSPSRNPIPRRRPILTASKLAFENAVSWYSAAYGLRSIRLRYFNAAGAIPRCRERHGPETHLIPLVLQAALGRIPELTDL